ncbi:MAG: hypothetical protein IAE79_09215 [Anaerolinea sp.]|nr:hypothetical protein [Anaerolinea sp.]
MHQYDDFEKQYEFETKRLVEYVYKSLASGNSVLTVKKELIFKGIAEQDAEYVVNYVYQKKRWQIAWQRAGGGAQLVTAGLGSIFAGLFIFSAGLFVSRTLSAIFPGISWLSGVLLLVGTIIFATGAVTSLWGAFRIMTASDDSMRGCMTAAVVGFVLILLGIVAYVLVSLF